MRKLLGITAALAALAALAMAAETKPPAYQPQADLSASASFALHLAHELAQMTAGTAILFAFIFLALLECFLHLINRPSLISKWTGTAERREIREELHYLRAKMDEFELRLDAVQQTLGCKTLKPATAQHLEPPQLNRRRGDDK